ncbi:MAG: nucleotidyltransferase domain-containing protein [Pseudomonadota bacterium]
MNKSNRIKNLLTGQELRAVSLFCDRLKKETGKQTHTIVLFGSRSRGEGHEDSDVDILIILKKEDHIMKVKIWDHAYKIFDETDIMISPLVLSVEQFEKLLKHERLIALTIRKEGIKL